MGSDFCTLRRCQSVPPSCDHLLDAQSGMAVRLPHLRLWRIALLVFSERQGRFTVPPSQEVASHWSELTLNDRKDLPVFFFFRFEKIDTVILFSRHMH